MMAGKLNNGKLAYRIDQAAEASGLGRSKLYEEIALGRLRAFKAGGRRLIWHEDLVAYLLACRGGD
jgi:excisionase family DNA binding protein